MTPASKGRALVALSIVVTARVGVGCGPSNPPLVAPDPVSTAAQELNAAPPEITAAPSDDAPPGVKPRHVDCASVEPGMPCTPDDPPPGLDGPPSDDAPPPGVKPRHVDCASVEPGMPCTPDDPPPGLKK